MPSLDSGPINKRSLAAGFEAGARIDDQAHADSHFWRPHRAGSSRVPGSLAAIAVIMAHLEVRRASGPVSDPKRQAFAEAVSRRGNWVAGALQSKARASRQSLTDSVRQAFRQGRMSAWVWMSQGEPYGRKTGAPDAGPSFWKGHF